MSVFCIVKGCDSNQGQSSPEVTFKKLPWDNIVLRTKWVKLAGYNPFDANDVKHITKDHTICSLHFNCDYDRIGDQMIPTLNLPEGVSSKELKSKHKPARESKKPNDKQEYKEQPINPNTNKSSQNNHTIVIPANDKKRKSSNEVYILRAPKTKKPNILRGSKKANEKSPKRNEPEEMSPNAKISMASPQQNNSVKQEELPPVPLSSVQASQYRLPGGITFPNADSSKEKSLLIISNHQQSVMASMYGLLKAGTFCDAILSNGETNVKIHKMVLSAVCPKILTIFDSHTQLDFPTVFFPATTTREALMAFTEYLYNGVLDLDKDILGHLKTIAEILEMENLEILCKDQLNWVANSDETNKDVEVIDVKQEICSNNEDLNFNSVTEATVAIENVSESGNNEMEIKIEPGDMKVEEPAGTTFQFVPDSADSDSSPEIPNQDTNLSIIQQAAAASNLPSLPFLSKNSSTTWSLPLYENVSESGTPPVGEVTSSHEQTQQVTKQMVSLINSNSCTQTIYDIGYPDAMVEVSVKKEPNT